MTEGMGSDAWVILAVGIFQSALVLGGGYALIVRNSAVQKAFIDGLKEEVKELKDNMKELSRVITDMAVANARMDNIEKRLTMTDSTVKDLSRGIGWQNDAGLKTVNREY